MASPLATTCVSINILTQMITSETGKTEFPLKMTVKSAIDIKLNSLWLFIMFSGRQRSGWFDRRQGKHFKLNNMFSYVY